MPGKYKNEQKINSTWISNLDRNGLNSIKYSGECVRKLFAMLCVYFSFQNVLFLVLKGKKKIK